MKRILVVEDDLSIQRMYQFKLEQAGYEVFVANNGKEGLAAAQEIKPDLILLDLRMPQMNGDEMLMKVRSQEWGAEIRVIILTNLSKDEAPSVLRMLYVDRYIVKAHYTPQQVLDVVHDVLSRR